MKRAAVLCLAAACFLWAGSPAHAGLITSGESTTPTFWSYKFSLNPQATWIGNENHGGAIFMPSGYEQAKITAPGISSDISSKILSWTNATASDPLVVSNKPFTIDLKIRDESGATHDFIFKGTLNGDLWKGGSTLTPTFSTPLTESYLVGDFTYQVSFKSFKSDWSNGEFRVSSFNFSVDHHNPEPSSLVLAGIGAPLFGMVLRRRRHLAPMS